MGDDFIIYTSKQKAKIIKQTLKNSKAGEIASELSKTLMPVYLGFRQTGGHRLMCMLFNYDKYCCMCR